MCGTIGKSDMDGCDAGPAVLDPYARMQPRASPSPRTLSIVVTTLLRACDLCPSVCQSRRLTTCGGRPRLDSSDERDRLESGRSVAVDDTTVHPFDARSHELNLQEEPCRYLTSCFRSQIHREDPVNFQAQELR